MGMRFQYVLKPINAASIMVDDKLIQYNNGAGPGELAYKAAIAGQEARSRWRN
jgi:hypothetical protein